MRNVLNIKDLNIHFGENCCQDVVIKGQIAKVFSAVLTFEALRCPNCGMENQQSIVKNGTKKSRIVLPEVSGVCGKINVHTIAAQKYIAPQAA